MDGEWWLGAPLASPQPPSPLPSSHCIEEGTSEKSTGSEVSVRTRMGPILLPSRLQLFARHPPSPNAPVKHQHRPYCRNLSPSQRAPMSQAGVHVAHTAFQNQTMIRDGSEQGSPSRLSHHNLFPASQLPPLFFSRSEYICFSRSMNT